MKRLPAFSFLACLLSLGGARDLAAQDLTIANARIIAGNGTVIPSGSIVVRGGRIASVAQGAANAQGMKTIDARGMSVMPGFIDAHRHVNTGPMEKEQMQQLLEAGYTTVLSGGGPAEGNIALRDHIEKGVINGPRIIPSGSLRLTLTPEQARAEVRKMAAMGIRFTGEISLTPKPAPTAQELETLRAIVDEGKKTGVYVQVHAVSPQAMMAAVDAGVPLLVHTPHFGWLSFEDAKKVAASGVKQLSTIGFGVPVFGVFADDNKPRFRDGKPWPESILDGDGRGQEAGYHSHALQVELDGLGDELADLDFAVSDYGTTWNVGRVGAVAGRAAFDDDGVSSGAHFRPACFSIAVGRAILPASRHSCRLELPTERQHGDRHPFHDLRWTIRSASSCRRAAPSPNGESTRWA